MTKKIVVALEGNAILTNDPTATGQQKTLVETAQSLAALVEKGYKLLITHGNGPQVGNLLLQQKLEQPKRIQQCHLIPMLQ